jgi:hypothetical protein
MSLLKNTVFNKRKKAKMEHNIFIFPDGRLDTKNTSLYLGLRPKTLAMWRTEGKGPKFVKRGRIFYFKEDLDQWINEQGRFVSTNQLRIVNRKGEN